MLSLLGSIAESNASGTIPFVVKEETQDAIFIEKNQPAPYSGILFTESSARELRSNLLESDKMALRFANEQNRSSAYFQTIKLKDQEIELYKSQNQKLLRLEDNSETMKYVWFGLGILVTSAAVYGARGLSK